MDRRSSPVEWMGLPSSMRMRLGHILLPLLLNDQLSDFLALAVKVCIKLFIMHGLEEAMNYVKKKGWTY